MFFKKFLDHSRIFCYISTMDQFDTLVSILSSMSRIASIFDSLDVYYASAGIGMYDILRDLQMSNRLIANALYNICGGKGTYPYPNPTVAPDAGDANKDAPLQPLPNIKP